MLCTLRMTETVKGEILLRAMRYFAYGSCHARITIKTWGVPPKGESAVLRITPAGYARRLN